MYAWGKYSTHIIIQENNYPSASWPAKLTRE